VHAPSHCPVGGCHLPTRSALAVPPGFDGLLRAMGRRLVASCSRPWGSRRFGAVLTGPGTLMQLAEALCLQAPVQVSAWRPWLLPGVRGHLESARYAHPLFLVVLHPSKVSPLSQPCRRAHGVETPCTRGHCLLAVLRRLSPSSAASEDVVVLVSVRRRRPRGLAPRESPLRR